MTKLITWGNAKAIAEVITPILTLAAIIVGINQYNKNSEMEFRKNFFTQQISVYDQLVEITGRIANYEIDSLENNEFQSQCKKLTDLYYGKLNIYQDNSVDSLVRNYIIALQRFKNYEVNVDNDFIRHLCKEISFKCRESMKNTYGVKLKDFITSASLTNK